MHLSDSQKRHLRGLAHHLKPIVWVGQHGLRGSVLAEVEQALDSHELVKVKIAAARDTRSQISAQICAQTGALAIHSIGQMVILFRRNPDRPRITLPSA